MASAQEYADYINRMRQLRQQREGGLMTQQQAMADAPKRPMPETTTGTMGQWGSNISNSFKGGVSTFVPDIASNLWDSTKAVGRGIKAAPGVIWSGTKSLEPKPENQQGISNPAKTATLPTTSTPSGLPKQSGTNAQIDANAQAVTTAGGMMGPPNLTTGSGMNSKTFVLGSNNDTIYSGGLGMKPAFDKYGLGNNSTNSVYTPEQMRAMGEGAGQGPMQVIPKSQMQFGNTNATQNAKAAAEYKAFMERTQAAKLAPMPVAQTRRERQAGLDRAANTEQVAASRAASSAENEANRANELAISQGRDKAVVSAAEQGRPLPKETDADKLKSLVQMYETAEPDIQKELWPQIKALLGGEQKPAAQTAKTAVPSTDAIAMLKKNPKLASEFDAKYGAGSSAKHIKG